MTTPQTAAPATPAAAAAPAAPAAAEAAPIEQTVGEQLADFDAAFDALTADTPPASPAPTPAPTTAPAAAPEASPAPTTAPAAAPAATAAPAAAPEVAALQQQIAALQAQVAAATPAPPAATQAPVAEVPLYSEDETAALKKYRADWSDVAAGEALARRAEYRELVGYIFGQIGPRLEALQSTTATTASHTQYASIKELVSDYDEVRDPTLAWIEKQPEYLKRTYQDLAESGSPADIADMIARFKKETGWKAPASAAAVPAAATPAAAAPPAAAAAAGVTALPAAAQAAIASLRPVATARTEQPQGVDMNDFDAAFAEFATSAR